MSWAVRLLLVASLLAGVFGLGWHKGSESVEVEWQAATVASDRAAAVQRDRQLARASTQAAAFEAYRLKNQFTLAKVSHDLQNALQRPIACPDGAASAVPLADLPIPAVVVDGLRRAAAGGDIGD